MTVWQIHKKPALTLNMGLYMFCFKSQSYKIKLQDDSKVNNTNIPAYTEINSSDNDFKYPSHQDTNNENTHAQEKR